MKIDLNHRTPKVYRLADISLNVFDRQVERGGDLIDVTQKEFDLFHFFLAESWRDPGRDLSNEEIVAAVWPKQLHTTAGTINRHTSNLRQKLQSECIKGTGGGHVLVGQVIDATPPEPRFLVFHRIAVVAVIASTVATLATTVTRAAFSAFDLTLTQAADAGFVLGWFQGVIGSIVWGLLITTGLFYFWFVVEDYDPWRGGLPWLRGAAVGGIAGFLAGLLNTLALLRAQLPPTLYAAGWLPTVASSRWTAFSVTRMGYSMPLFGTVIGGCCAVATLWIVHRPEWGSVLTNNPKLTTLHDAATVIRAIAKETTAAGAAFILLPMAAAAVWMYLLLGNPAFLPRIIGECLVISVGGASLVAGILLALYALTKGVDLTGEIKCSLGSSTIPKP